MKLCYYIVCFVIALIAMCASCSDSIEPQQQAHELFEQSKQYKKEKDVERQITTLIQAYQLLPQFDEPVFASKVCQALGNAYMFRKLYDQSLDYNREAIAYAMQEEPHSKQLSLAYSQLGRTFAELNETDSAFLYFDRALNQAILLQDTTEIAVGYGQLGVVSRLKKDYQKALDYERQQLTIYKQHNDSGYIPQAYYGIGSTFYYMRQLDSAKVYFENSLHTNNIYTKQGAYKALYLISKNQGKLEDAIRYNDKFRDYADSVSLYNKTEAVAEIQAKYDYTQLQIQRKNYYILFLGASLIIVLLVAAGFFFVRWYNNRQKKYRETLKRILTEVYRKTDAYINEKKLEIEEVDHILGDLSFDNKLERSQQKYRRESLRIEMERAKAEQELQKKRDMEIMQSEVQDMLISHINLGSNMRSEDWALVEDAINKTYPNFTTQLRAINGMTDIKYKVCLLTKLHQRNSDIATLVNRSPSAITRLKERFITDLGVTDTSDISFNSFIGSL